MKHDRIDPELISELADVESDALLASIYLPLTARFAARGKNATRIKNLLADAMEQLQSADDGTGGTGNMLEAVRGDTGWMNLDARSANGAAVFVDDKRLRVAMLPNEPEEMAVVAGSYHLRPLIEASIFVAPFYVLALSRNEVTLFLGKNHDLEPVELSSDTPGSLSDALGHELTDRQLQHHAGDAGSDVAIHHGHGSGKDDTDAEVEHFLQIVDKGLCGNVLDGSPMILAGVDELTAHYRRVTHYDQILDETISGNVESIGEQKLAEQAWQAFYEDYCRRAADAMQRVASGDAERPGTADLEKIVTAAEDGRIAKLFVSSDRHAWGNFSRADRRVFLHADRQALDTDLLDCAARLAWKTGAEVFPLPSDHFPDDYSAVALLRYDVSK